MNTSFVTYPLSAGGTPIDPHALPHYPGLSKENDETAWFHALFPNVFYFCLPHSIFTVVLRPAVNCEDDQIAAAFESKGAAAVSDAVRNPAAYTLEFADLTVHRNAVPRALLPENRGDPELVAQLEEEEKAGETPQGKLDAEKRAKLDAAWSFYEETNLEDIEVCENVQRGLAVDEYKGGRFSFRFEETIHRFQNIYADAMCGVRRIPPGDEDSPPGAERFIDESEV